MDYRTLHAKTVADLRLLARQNGVKIPAGTAKMRIIEMILDAEKAQADNDIQTKSQSDMNAPAAEQQETPETPVKKRGRPKGSGKTVQTDSGEEKPKKKRGRPPKQKTEETTENKNAIQTEKEESEKDEICKTDIASAEIKAQEQIVPVSVEPASVPVKRESPPFSLSVKANTQPIYAPRTNDIRPTSYKAECRKPEANLSDILHANDYPDGAGVLEIHPEGYGFLRAENYLPGTKDVYISIAQIRRFSLRSGDYVVGKTRAQREGDRYVAMLYITSVNGKSPEEIVKRPKFEDLTPIYPDERIRLENPNGNTDLALRCMDLIAPIGKGQRGMIVSPPKAGKTVLLKKIANAITRNEPNVHLIVLLIDERPEEVTDLKRSIQGEVVYSTFDEAPENHTRLSEMALDRAQRLVECGEDVVILMDSITRLARAYNLVIPPTGRSLSGGLDPGALFKPKRFFGAARNIENGGSLTIIATALVETGSRMDDIIFEEFKGTGNMELHLDRKLSEKRIFPAVDLFKSGTRRDELLLNDEEYEGAVHVRHMLSNSGAQETTEQLITLLEKTRFNTEFLNRVKGWANVWEKEGFTLSGDGQMRKQSVKS